MIWTGWNLARIIVLLVGLAYLMIFIQVTMFHYRQNFRNLTMLLPVIAGPVIGIIAMVLALGNTPVLIGLFKVLLWLGILGGLLGFLLHFQGERGELPNSGPWQDLPQPEFFKKLLSLVVESYYSHPVIWSEIGYGGPAYPRGYVRTELNLTDPWEAKADQSTVDS